MKSAQVGARLLEPLIVYLDGHGVNPARLITRAGLSQASLADPDARVDADKAVQLFLEAERAMRDPLIGLRVGATVTRDSFDLLSQATAVSGTLREMAERTRRFLPLAVTRDVYVLRERDEQALWTIGPVFGRRRCVRHLCELAVSLGVTYVRKHLGDRRAVTYAFFDHAPAVAPRLYEQILETKVHFAQPESGFSMPRALLDRPLPHADPGLSRVLDRFAERSLRELPRDEGLQSRVRHAIDALLSTGKEPSLGAVARALGVGTRTLQRRLQAEEASFQALLDDARRTLALRMVAQDGASMSDAAARLGFSDAAAFRRAFKRWTGASPRAYAQRVRRP